MAAAIPPPCDSPPPPARMLSRPFSASDRRRSALVEVLVLGGEHLVTRAREPISSYVACRLTREQQRPRLDVVGNVNDEDSDGSVVYDLQSSPFAVTRVVERSAAPLWNELLLLPVDQDDESDGALSLVVDVVQRDASQQEDSLVATACIPLRRQQSQQPLALEFPPTPSADAAAPRMRVYLLVMALPAETETHSGSSVCEVVVNSLTVTTPTTEAAIERSVICVAPSQSAEPVSRVDLRSLFTTIDGSSQSNDVVAAERTAALTPAAARREDCCRWKFPLVWHHHGISSSTELRVSWFRLAGEPQSMSASQLVASGCMVIGDIADDGSASTLSVPLSEAGETVGSMSLVVRLWGPQSWQRFQQLRATRRVVCTNRRDRRRAELLALEWTSALCRGLNRYPLSSFYDTGGLSTLLAEYLAASTPATAAATQSNPLVKTEASADCGGSDVTRMLNEHIRLLQQEVVAKQQSIAKLNTDLEERTNALRVCGIELLSTRKELRARDHQIAQLSATIDSMKQREAEQLRELVTDYGPGASLDSTTSQRLSLLAIKYKELDQRHRAAEAALAEAKRMESGYAQLERKYAELEQAHLAQAEVVQRLQRDKTKTVELERLVRLQEDVIRKLEAAVRGSNKSKQTQSPAPVSVLVATADVSNPTDSVRVRVLEEQLQRNARAAASEISRLKLRIMELEAQVMERTQDGDRD